jgi:hypothetical protein
MQTAFTEFFKLWAEVPASLQTLKQNISQHFPNLICPGITHLIYQVENITGLEAKFRKNELHNIA